MLRTERRSRVARNKSSCASRKVALATRIADEIGRLNLTERSRQRLINAIRNVQKEVRSAERGCRLTPSDSPRSVKAVT